MVVENGLTMRFYWILLSGPIFIASFLKLSTHSSFVKLANTCITSAIPTNVNYYLKVTTSAPRNRSIQTAYCPPPMSWSPLIHLSERPVQLQRSFSLEQFRSVISCKTYLSIFLLLPNTTPTKRVVTLFTNFLTSITTAIFCSPHSLIKSSLIFCRSRVLFSNELTITISCISDATIFFTISSYFNNFRLKFSFDTF